MCVHENVRKAADIQKLEVQERLWEERVWYSGKNIKSPADSGSFCTNGLHLACGVIRLTGAISISFRVNSMIKWKRGTVGRIFSFSLLFKLRFSLLIQKLRDAVEF